jgi:hypothetical protein
MRHCTVTVEDDEGIEHALEVEADSLYAAEYTAVREWAIVSWWKADGVIEVRSGNQRWRISARRVSAWNSERYRKGQQKR